MNIFAMIRRILWGGLLAVSIVVGILYLAVASVFLSTSGLKTIATESHLAQTVRDDVLLPKVLASVKTSQYATLLDDATVTKAFDSAVSLDDLNKKLTPAIESLQGWLDSKQPDISFSIDTSDLSGRFATTLSQAVSTKLVSAPRCTFSNTLGEVKNGACRSPFIPQSELTKTITSAIKDEPALQNTTITQATIPLTASLQRTIPDLPSYLNVFYGASILAAGIIILTSLWLLFKHRVAGVISIGATSVAAALTLYILTLILPQAAARFAGSRLPKDVTTASIDAFNVVLRHDALLLAIGGIAAIILGSIIVTILARRQQTHRTMHL